MTLYRPGPVTVDWRSDNEIIVRSQPAFYSASVTGQNGAWKVTLLTQWRTPETFRERSAALNRAAKIVSKLGYDFWRTQMSPVQRVAIGQQQCPYLLGHPLCRARPDVGSVWCAEHVGGQ